MATTAIKRPTEFIRTLPSDDIRQIMWRFADRMELQMVIQAARGVARGPIARLVANGGRNSHEWTAQKSELLKEFDASGITSIFMDPEYGGYVSGPKNLALALIAFELAWVDAGAATGSLAGCLALGPIHERGTPEQVAYYMSRAVPPAPGEHRQTWRGAFCLTEPLPFVGVETGLLAGRVSVAEWDEGKEPILEVDKRGRFITNMGFANFVTAAVDSPRSTHQGQLHGHTRGNGPRHLRPRYAHPEAGPSAIFHLRSHLPPPRSGQSHRGRLHRQGRGHHSQLQPWRNHRSRVPAYARNRRHHDVGQVVEARSTGDPLPTRSLPRQRRGAARLAPL